MESLACGTPCAAFNIGGFPDMIEHQKNGYLARPYDPEDLAKGIDWILNDQNRWHTLSISARLKVENEFEIKSVVKRYVQVYKSVIAAEK